MLLAESSLLSYAGVIALLILLEGLLSADNALVVALLVKHLPPRERRNALLVGLGGSAILRLLALLAAKSILRFWYLQALGAAYLLYLRARHFWPKREGGREAAASRPGLSFWKTVVLVEFTDLVFAIDSVLVAVTVSDNMVIIYIGVISGVILLRFAAFVLTRLIDKMPGLEHMAYILVAWVAVKLAFMSVASANETYEWGWPVADLNPTAFWSVTGAILVVGAWLVRRQGLSRKRKAAERTQE